MEIAIYVILSLVVGIVVGWLVRQNAGRAEFETRYSRIQQEHHVMQSELAAARATHAAQLSSIQQQLKDKVADIASSQQSARDLQTQLNESISTLAGAKAELRSANQLLADRQKEDELRREEGSVMKQELLSLSKALASANARNDAQEEKSKVQKEEIESLNKKFALEFENVANRILEAKTQRFTELNRANLHAILEPLGKNITEFKSKVEEVYQQESQQRFSLGERVKELAELNRKISEEAHNLTRALKSESKTQGGWGEMILENILDRSGLVKDREYFLEHQLRDEQGNALRSDHQDKKMRPDAVIKYPDKRHVIIDSKVSLNAFTRAVDAIDEANRLQELAAHVDCIKKHVQTLSAKGYDDYDKSLDFVMLFVPSEPAYIAALQAEPELWNYAYDRRILLLSPTNLITSLKLIVDLWKREYQNQNANEIAERGAKLYDKFVGFAANLKEVGEYLQRAQNKYGDAYKQLTTGNDNLVTQAIKLKNLGLKTKKHIPDDVLNGTEQDGTGDPLPE